MCLTKTNKNNDDDLKTLSFTANISQNCKIGRCFSSLKHGQDAFGSIFDPSFLCSLQLPNLEFVLATVDSHQNPTSSKFQLHTSETKKQCLLLNTSPQILMSNFQQSKELYNKSSPSSTNTKCFQKRN